MTSKFTRNNNATRKQETRTGDQARKQQTSAALTGLWTVTVLVWPLLKWIVALDCVYQLARAVYYWDTPGMYAGWKFLLHFGVLTALTYFVMCYQPQPRDD